MLQRPYSSFSPQKSVACLPNFRYTETKSESIGKSPREKSLGFLFVYALQGVIRMKGDFHHPFICPGRPVPAEPAIIGNTNKHNDCYCFYI
jgi:hypothetical protein